MSSVASQENDSQDSAIWLRRPRESGLAYAAFCVYREQVPPRSTAKVAKGLGKTLRHIQEWSRKWHWVERANAYTDHLDSIALAAHEEDIVRRRREENEQLHEMSQLLRMPAIARIAGVKSKDGKKWSVAPVDPNHLDPDDIVRWLEASVKMGRLSVGLPTDVTGTISVSMADLNRILGAFLDIAESLMDEESHEALVRQCYAMVRESLGG